MKRIVVVAVCVIVFFIFLYVKEVKEPSKMIWESTISEILEEKEESSFGRVIEVSVSGAVWKSGSYQLSISSTLGDLLKICHVKANADISNINLVEKLRDKQHYYIHSIEDEEETKGSSEEREELLNINKASFEELDALPGIGMNRAMAILNYIAVYGEIENYEQLRKIIAGISDKDFESIKSQSVLK